MSLTNTEYGKAYEYACLKSLEKHLLEKGVSPISITESDALKTARDAFNKADAEGLSKKLVLAADAASRIILRLEPQLEHGKGALTLVIQTDAQGIAGDVRDVVCIRGANGWEIGLSCKHNHQAVKHSRLSATIDFGKEWFGVPCSKSYFDAVVPLFDKLKRMRAEAVSNGKPIPLWNDLPNKVEDYYLPVLHAFLDEMKRLSQTHADIPQKLIEYMLGRYDFYKVITDDSHKTTRVEAINIAGTLNKSINGHKSIVDVAKLKMPTCFYHMDMVPGSDNKVTIVCDEGWTLTMRIHNASSKIEPSLKFDVQLISVPNSIHVQVEPW